MHVCVSPVHCPGISVGVRQSPSRHTDKVYQYKWRITSVWFYSLMVYVSEVNNFLSRPCRFEEIVLSVHSQSLISFLNRLELTQYFIKHLHCDCSVTLFTNCTLSSSYRKKKLFIKKTLKVSQHPIPTIDKLDDGVFFYREKVTWFCDVNEVKGCVVGLWEGCLTLPLFWLCGCCSRLYWDLQWIKSHINNQHNRKVKIVNKHVLKSLINPVCKWP